MNKLFRTMAAGALSLSLIATSAFAGDTNTNYGAVGSQTKDDYTLDEMLQYAIEDEYLAKAEYDAIIKEFKTTTPYTNITKSEQTHINLLLDLYKTLGKTAPSVSPESHVVLPKTLAETFAINVKVEKDNIAMYDKFLKDESLPAAAKDVFTKLRNASVNHLKAFERGAERGTTGTTVNKNTKAQNGKNNNQAKQGNGKSQGNKYGQSKNKAANKGNANKGQNRINR